MGSCSDLENAIRAEAKADGVLIRKLIGESGKKLEELCTCWNALKPILKKWADESGKWWIKVLALIVIAFVDSFCKEAGAATS
jgi:hypothetical protein